MWRWARILFLIGLLSLAWSVYYLTRPERMAAFASDVLRRLYRGTEPGIGSAKFNLKGEIELTDLRLYVEGVGGQAGEVFRADKARLWVEPLSVFTGSPRVKRIEVDGPVLSITELEPDRFNVDALREMAMRGEPGAGEDIRELPSVELRDGVVRYGEAPGGVYRELGRVGLSGSLEPDAMTARRYIFQLTQKVQGEAPQSGATLIGWLDLNNFSVEADLTGLNLSNPHRFMLPRAIRAAWDRMEPEGAISGLLFRHSPDGGTHAELSVRGVALTLPQLSAPEYKARVSNVEATFAFEGARMEIREMTGRMDDLRYHIDGTLEGYSPDAPFELRVKTDPFRIPEEPRYLIALPRQVQKIFRMFSPAGWMALDVTVRRAETGGGVELRGESRILSGSEALEGLMAAGIETGDLRHDSPELNSHGHFSGFPYELSHAKGRVSFTEEEVVIENLEGDAPGGGRLVIDGRIAPLTDDAQGDLSIRAVNLPLDADLLNALTDDQRAAVEMFFHRPSFDALRASGRIEEGFELGGRIDARVFVRGPVAQKPGPGVETHVELKQANVVFEFFPYPVRVTGGVLHIADGKVEFQNVTFEGLRGGAGTIHGPVVIEKGGGTRVVKPDLRVSGSGFPVDELLTDVLGEKIGSKVEGLRLRGRAGYEGRVLYDEASRRVDVDLTVLLSEATAAPGAGGYTLENIEGTLKVRRDRALFEKIHATHGEAVFELTGDAAWGSDAEDRLNLHVTGEGLRFEEPVLDLVSGVGTDAARAAQFVTDRQPTGVFDATADYTVQQGGGSYRVAIEPKELSVFYGGKRVSMSGASGRIVFEPAQIVIEEFTSGFAGGRLNVSGVLPEAGSPSFALSVAGEGVGEELLHVMPARMGQALRQMGFNGAYDLDLPTLRFAPGGGVEEMNGSLRVRGGTGRLGVVFDSLDALLELRADPSAAEAFTVRARDARMRFADHPFESVAVDFIGGRDGVTRLTQLTGLYAGGRVAGEGRVVQKRGEYRFHFVLSDASLGLLSTGSAGEEPKGGPAGLPGLVSASLDMDGSFDEPDSMRGQGVILIRQTELYGLPMAIGVLKMTHLSLPVSKPFTEARIGYFLHPTNLEFESIRLGAESMSFTGSGTMKLPGRELDLTLKTRNPKGLDLGALTDLIAKFRDELITIRITGTLEKPDVKVRQLQGLAGAVGDVLGGKGGVSDVNNKSDGGKTEPKE